MTEPISWEPHSLEPAVDFQAVCHSGVARVSPDDGNGGLRALEAEMLQRSAELESAYERLRESEEKYRTLFNSIDDGFCIIKMLFDGEGKPVDYIFLELNAAFERHTGLENVVGKHVSEMVDGHESYWFDVYGKVALTGEPTRFANQAAGMGRWFEVYALRIGAAEEHRVAVVFRDITVTKRSELNTHFLATVTQDLTRLTCEKEIMSVVGENIGAFLRLTVCTFMEINETMESAVVRHVWQKEGVPKIEGTYRIDDFVTGEFQQTCRAGNIFVVHDTATDSRTDAEQYAAIDVEAFVSVPIVREGEWRFLLVMMDSKPHAWREDEIELMREVTLRIWTSMERRRAEDALRRSEERVRRALAIETVGVIFFKTDGGISEANDAFLRMSGYSREDLLAGCVRWDLQTPPEFMGLSRKAIEQFMTKGRTIPYEKQYIRKDGTRWWGLFAATRIGEDEGVEFVLNVDERKSIEAALAASEERLRLILDNARDYAIFSMDLERRVTSWNTGSERLLGFEEAEILGRQADVIFLPEDQAERIPQKEAEVAIAEGKATDERWHQRKDGSRFWASGVMTVMQNSTGEAIGLVKILRDKTDERETEQALEASRKQAVAANLAKDNFLATLSHELRTPLNPVLMSVSDMESDLTLSPETRQQLGMMRRNIELEARLIDDLLDTTLLSRGKLQLHTIATNVHGLLHHTEQIVRSDMGSKSLDLHMLLEAGQHHVMADPARLQQVFWNLLKNSIKFTSTGGKITVRTSNPGGGIIRIEVEDTGIGMTESALGAVFRAFDQGDLKGRHEFGGLGLGLSISKAIVDLHGGRLAACSEGPGKGSLFTLDWAVTTPREEPKKQEPPKDPEGKVSPLRLLVVEDDAATLSVMVRLLRRDGHDVLPATSIKQALELAANHPFDLLISDLGLPDGSGNQLMQEIKLLQPCPGIALSGFGMDRDIKESKRAGFDAHIIKPVDLKRLRFLIATLSGNPSEGANSSLDS